MTVDALLARLAGGEDVLDELSATLEAADDDEFAAHAPQVLEASSRVRARPPVERIALWAQRLADLADDADQPTRAWSLALSVHPGAASLLQDLATAVVDGDYACEDAFARVAKSDPEHAGAWHARERAARFHVAAGVESRDTALLWLAESIRTPELVAPTRAAAAALQDLAPGWRCPTDDEWELVRELL